MKPQVRHHGDGLYVVSERDFDSTEQAFVVYGNAGPLTSDVASFDAGAWRLDLKIQFQGRDFSQTSIQRRDVSEASQPAMPYLRRFGFAPRDDTLSLEALKQLGAAMRFNDLPDDPCDIPAAYTYLGQFIFHDCSFMADGNSAVKPVNKRSAALDLDSIFNVSEDHPPIVGCPASTGPMPIGCTEEERKALDLPRTATGQPVIGDSRNDDNLPLAQVHMALLRFYNAVAQVEPNADEAKKLTALHFQSVVLHDYLKRVIAPDVYCDVLENGRAIIDPTPGKSHRTPPFLLPLEFAAACGRFGHSMIRNNYNWNQYHPGADLTAFWDNTFSSSPDPTLRLRDRWYARWQRLLGMDLEPGESPIMAARIGTRFAWLLGRIATEALPDAGQFDPPSLGNNLASRSLERGHILRLNSGQAIALTVRDALMALGRPSFEILTEPELLVGETTAAQGIMTRFGITRATPLWFYTLKEAAVRSDGKCLGPLGSRIVMETLHAAIDYATPSILTESGHSPWRPDPRLRPASPVEYTFPDLIRFASLSQSN
jgi:hypothetical protein